MMDEKPKTTLFFVTEGVLPGRRENDQVEPAPEHVVVDCVDPTRVVTVGVGQHEHVT